MVWRAGFWRLALILGLGGCGEEARISASAGLAPPLDPQMLTVTVHDRDREVEWTGAAFRVTPVMHRFSPDATRVAPLYTSTRRSNWVP